MKKTTPSSFLKDIQNELQQEALVTRAYLALVDFTQAEFQPHEKSEKFGRLAIHVAEIIGWWENVLQSSELNFADFEPETITTTEELLTYFDQLLSSSLEALQMAKEETLDQQWSMKLEEQTLFTLNKKEVLRKFCMNHLIHHRAQLGVYLRIQNKPVPGTYGPSADDRFVVLTESFS